MISGALMKTGAEFLRFAVGRSVHQCSRPARPCQWWAQALGARAMESTFNAAP